MGSFAESEGMVGYLIEQELDNALSASARSATCRVAPHQYFAFPITDRGQGCAYGTGSSSRLLVDFGLRRAHGAEAGLLAARASFIAGFAGTATMLAGKLFGIPIYGTMHPAYDSEQAAFEAFARSRPENLILLIDAYDTEEAAHTVVSLAPRLSAAGIAVRGVRLDSGDLISLSKSVRRILDDGGLKEVTIFVSGGLDECELAKMHEDGVHAVLCLVEDNRGWSLEHLLGHPPCT
jgi:Nicotinate phosphoribosyltransferase (NAPRTase) family